MFVLSTDIYMYHLQFFMFSAACCRYPKDWVIPLGVAFSVYGWGHNHRGQLGGVEGNKIKTPRLCEAFSELSPMSVVGGEQTMFAITRDGKVKLNTHTVMYLHMHTLLSYRPCFSPPPAITLPPSLPSSPPSLPLSLPSLPPSPPLCCQVYVSGYGAHGRLGIGGVDSVSTPTLITSLATRGELYIHTCTWGDPYNQNPFKSRVCAITLSLSLSLSLPPSLPPPLSTGIIISKVACHSGGKHSLALTTNGEMYSWGEGDDGKLGHGGTA